MDIQYVDKALDVIIEKYELAKAHASEAEEIAAHARADAEKASDTVLRFLNAIRLLQQAKKNLVSDSNQGTTLS